MNPHLKKIGLYTLFLGVAVLLMWWLYKDVSWENELKPALQTVHWGWVMVSFAFGYLATILRGFRWNIMLEPLGYHTTKWNGAHAVAFGYSMNYLIPRSGELARCTMLYKVDRIPVNTLIGNVILERIVDMALLCCFIVAAFILNTDAIHQLFAQMEPGKARLLGYALLAAIAGAIVFISLLKRLSTTSAFLGKINDFVQGIVSGISTIFKLKQQFAFWMYSLGIWFSWLMMTYCSMLAIQATNFMTLHDTVFFMAAGSLGMIVPTPGGAGSFHGMSVLAFEALGYPGALGKVYALISWSIKTAFEILVGVIGFMVLSNKASKQTGHEPTA
ncbi:MAG: lysylphosphatidylglycerol synthase transmembrane domain-containing protein [Flavobacteriales bacterium]